MMSKTCKLSFSEVKETLFNLQTEVQKNKDEMSVPRGSLEDTSNKKKDPKSILYYLIFWKKIPFYGNTLPKMLGPNSRPHGTRHTASVGRPKNLHPFSNWSDVASWINSCSVSVATTKFGIYETLSPDMAIKMEERTRPETGIPEYWIHLRDGVYWQPLHPNMFSEEIKLADFFQKKHQVTASDFKFAFDATMNPFLQESGAVAMRNYLEGIEKLKLLMT